MPKQTPLSASRKALIARYLTWAYKSTKESFDRLERKTTQAMVDEFIWKGLNSFHQADMADPAYKALVDDFRRYVDKKSVQPVDQAQYRYLSNRLLVIEKAVKHFLGDKALSKMRCVYEEEFTRRIWESKDH